MKCLGIIGLNILHVTGEDPVFFLYEAHFFPFSIEIVSKRNNYTIHCFYEEIYRGRNKEGGETNDSMQELEEKPC